MRADEYGEIAVPPTIHALLEARLDKLARERAPRVEPASVIGLEFPQPAVEAMLPEPVARDRRRAPDDPDAQALHRPGREPRTPRRAFASTITWCATPSTTACSSARAPTCTCEFVRWADKVNAERDRALEFEEILGYHLEQAHRYLAELGPLDENGLAVGSDAARRLLGRPARLRARRHARGGESVPARRRAAAGRRRDAPELLPELGEALMELGDFAESRAALDEAHAAAERADNERLKAAARLVSMRVRLYSASPATGATRRCALASEAIPVLEAECAHDELAHAWRLIGFVHGIAGELRPGRGSRRQSMTHARLAGDARLVARNGVALSSSALFGPTPVPAGHREVRAAHRRGLERPAGESNRHVHHGAVARDERRIRCRRARSTGAAARCCATSARE